MQRWGSVMQASTPSSRARTNGRPPAWQPPSGWSSTRLPKRSSPNMKALGATPSMRSSGATRSPPTHRRTLAGCLSLRLTSPTCCALCRPSGGHRAGPNPARWRGQLEHILANPEKVAPVKHRAAVPVTDLPAAYQQIAAVDGQSARALCFLILTAARSGEVRGMCGARSILMQPYGLFPLDA